MKQKSFIEKNYGFKVIKISLLRESPDNKVYLLKTKSQAYIARISKRNIQKEVLFEINWLDYLLKQNIPVPKVVKMNNNLFFVYNKLVIVLFEFLKGKPIVISATKKPDLNKVKEASLQLAQIHNVSFMKELNFQRKRNILTEIDRALKIKDKFIKFSKEGKEFVNNLIFYKKWAEEKKDEKYLIHNDYRPNNILFINNKISAILDFDWACKGPAVKDVALALAEWSFPDGAKNHWQPVFKIFLENYNQKAKNQIKLNKNLYRWLCFSCLSDAATYFADLAKENIFKKISSSYMYKKFLYFKKFL